MMFRMMFLPLNAYKFNPISIGSEALFGYMIAGHFNDRVRRFRVDLLNFYSVI